LSRAPRTLPIRPASSRSTSSAQVLGQSCGQTDLTESRGMTDYTMLSKPVTVVSPERSAAAPVLGKADV